MDKQPKDYAKPIVNEVCPDRSNPIATLIWLLMTVLGAFFIPYITMVVVLILKFMEINDGR